MSLLPPINFKNWIEENRHLLKPPVGNKVVYENSDFMVMVVGGPNSRKDYHVDPVEEFFYQIEGDMVLKVMNDHNRVDIPIKEGEMFLLPKNIPHSKLIKFVKDRKGHDFRYAINSNKLDKKLKFKSKYQFDKNLNLTIHWYLNNYKWLHKKISK